MEKFNVKEFSLFKVGDQAEFSHMITNDDVHQFAKLSGDYNPLHLDEGFAQKTNFRKPVVHGMLSASYISTMIGMLMPGPGALWSSQTIEFLHPAYVGDTITVKAVIKHISIAIRTLVLDIAIINQDGMKIITGESTVKLLEMEKRDKKKMNDSIETVLITGASRGIGREIAIALSQKEKTVIINYSKSEAEAKEVEKLIKAEGGKAISYKADISNYADVMEMVNHIRNNVGFIKAVVHCAAPVTPLDTVLNLEWNHIQMHLDIQLKGAFNCVKAVLPDMIELKKGAFVFLGSVASDGLPPQNQADYVIAKAALSSLMKSVAVEYGPKGITSNMISPGMTQTDRIQHIPEKAKLLVKMQTPMRRLTETNDISNLVSFLLSPKSGYITGETFRICGGSTMI